MKLLYLISFGIFAASYDASKIRDYNYDDVAKYDDVQSIGRQKRGIYSGPQVEFLSNGSWRAISLQNLVTQGHLHQKGYRHASGTQTWDTWRYANTKRFPLRTEFTDAANVKWRVSIRGSSDQVSMVVPIQRELRFYGDEGDKVGVDSNCRFAQLTFSYQPGSIWHSHGIRLKTNGLVDKSDKNTDDWDHWTEIFSTIQQGVDLTSSVVDLGSKFVGPRKG